jgi:hypothetical protein
METQIIMADPNANKNYVERYISLASLTDNEDLRNDALYRAGTQMEVLPCDGNNDLTPQQQQTVFEAAKELLA